MEQVYKLVQTFSFPSHSLTASVELSTSPRIQKMKTLVVFALVVLAAVCTAKPTPGGHGGYGGGGNSNIYHSQQTDHYGYAGPYKFGYTVDDHYTGDYHGRHEAGDGHGGVSGSYHLREPDGSLREVKYVADYNGFRAIVNGVPHGYGGYH